MLVALILGAVVGAVLGLTGAGGGMLAVPALVAGLGWTMQQAAPVALIAVAAGAAIGAIEGWRRRLVRYRAAALMAVSGLLVTPIGLRAAHLMSQTVLLVIFAAVMLLVALRLGRSAIRAGRAGPQPDPESESESNLGRIDGDSGRFVWNGGTAALIAGVGAATGFMTGLLGVGGGFVIVPLLRRFTGLTMPSIVATSLLVIAIVGAGGVATAVLHGAALPAVTTLSFAAATAAGMMAGRLASRRLSERHVQIAFAAVLFVVAIGLIIKAVAGSA